MSVFRDSPWEIGHGQVRFGLGGLFRSVARAVMPMIKREENALGNIGGAHIGEVADMVKKKVIQRVNTYA